VVCGRSHDPYSFVRRHLRASHDPANHLLDADPLAFLYILNLACLSTTRNASKENVTLG